jgi:mannose-6-phosphate isomerase-like protein (cupin superfamily)
MNPKFEPADIHNSEHYTWGDVCEGWHLLKRDDVSVIQERVLPGKSETTHFHKLSRQFFFVLEGDATVVTDSQNVVLTKHQGVEIPPGVPHQFRNGSSSDVSFLVISVPKSHGDRYELKVDHEDQGTEDK